MLMSMIDFKPRIEEEEEEEEVNADGKTDEETEAPEPIETETSEETETKEDDLSKKKETIDYDAVIAEERKRREEVEAKLAETREKARERIQKKHESEENMDVDNDEDRPITSKELKEILAEDRKERQQEAQISSVRSAAKDIASSDAETNAIVEYYKGRIVPTGNVEEDVLAAYAVLHARSSTQKISELRRALQSKTNASKDTATTHVDVSRTSEPKLTGQDAQAIKAAGYKWDGKTSTYTKPIGKKVLHYDPKTKKRFTTAS